jgi:triacylglycerol lipase
MIAFLLRVTLIILAVVLLAQYYATNPAVAALSVVSVFVALHTGCVVASFVISRRHAFKAPSELTPSWSAAAFTVVREWLAYLALFVVIQPFERACMTDDAREPCRPGGIPVLLIHGYLCNRGIWWWIRRKLTATGFVVATINLEPPTGSIEKFADQLHARIEAFCADAGASQVALVSHSMGGLVARAYLRKHGPLRVAKLVTLACPHHGTWLAFYGVGANAREMEPDSAWIRSLNLTDPGVPMLSIWSPYDNVVAPQDSSRLPGVRDQAVPALGHLAELFSPLVFDILARELAHHDAIQR